MKNLQNIRIWGTLLGGFAVLLGFFLPFLSGRPLFHILENSPFPFFSPLMVLLTVLAMVLHSLELPIAAFLFSSILFLGWLLLLLILLLTYSPAILAENLGPGAYLLSLGVPAMAFCPG